MILERQRRAVSDPIRGLTLERLAAQIDAYTNGWVAEFAMTAEAMEQRDDMLKNVAAKRKKAVTRHGWEILAENDSTEARAQREALDYFYRHLTCTHALRKDERGGFQLLLTQMMDAIGKGYAVHEIVWQPKKKLHRAGKEEHREHRDKAGANVECRMPNEQLGGKPDGRISRVRLSGEPSPVSLPKLRNDGIANERSFEPSSAARPPHSTFEIRHSIENRHWVTAQFTFVPLWYFEGSTGKLRLLTAPSAVEGEPLADRQWLVTVGEALMVACSRAFLFKHYPLQAWLDYAQRFGLPGVRGITGAARGTAEFADMEAALKTFMTDLSVVTNNTEAIDVVDLKGSGAAPFGELVERMDRVMASLWRGADLSTISRDRGYGATLQEQEAKILEQDDARMLSEHLNATVDRWVLDQLFGPETEALARVKILVTPRECTPHDLAVDQFLVRHGARLSLTETMERYGRAAARPDEPALGPADSPQRTQRTQRRSEIQKSGMEGRAPVSPWPRKENHQ